MNLPQPVQKHSHRPSPWAITLSTLLLASPLAHSATSAWNTGTDVYSNPNAWNPVGVPNSTATTADVGNGGTVQYATPLTNVLGSLLLGEAAGSGTFILSGGELDITNSGATGLIMGNADSSQATLQMDGGTLTIKRNASTFFQDIFQLGNRKNSVATFTLNNGTVTCLGGLEIGAGGEGTLNINGGTFIDNGWFGLGRGGNGTNGWANLNLTGGTLYLLRNPGTDTGLNGMSFCQGATNGTANISGGSLYTSCIRFGTGSPSPKDWQTLNVSGGDLYIGGGGVISNSNAGTHIVAINLSGGTFHSVDMEANTGGTLGLASLGATGTNWSWAATLPINLANSPGAGTVTFTPEANRTFTLNSPISGPGTLRANGAGTVVLAAPEAYTGGTLLQSGTLALAAAQTNLLNLTISSGATFALSTGGSLADSSIYLPGGATLAFAANNSQAFTNTVSGAGDVVAALGGNGVELVTGTLGHTGKTTVTSGILTLASPLASTSLVVVSNTGTLAGNSQIAAPVIVNSTNGTGAAHLRMGLSPLNIPDTLTINNTLTLGVGSELDVKLGTATTTGSGVNDLLVVNGNLAIDPTAVLNVVPLQQLSPGTYVIATYTGTLTGQFSSTVSGLTRYTFALDYSTPGQIKLTVGGSNASLVWYGLTNGVAAPLWNVQGSANWTNPVAGALSTFDEGDAVTFDDTARSTSVQLATTLYPASIIFNNVYSNYSVTGTGSGRITGGTSITKNGAGTVTLAAGLGVGNDYTGPVQINGGILKMNGALTLGATNGATIVNNGGTLDLNGQTPNDEPFVLQGSGLGGTNGAINNTGSAVNLNGGPRRITLAGDTVINAANARWDIGINSLGAGGGYFLGNNHALTKIGNNDIWLHEVGDTGLGDISILQGTLGFQYNIGLGNAANTVFVATNATLGLWQVQSVLNKNVALTNATLFSNGGTGTSNALNGALTLIGTNTINTAGGFPLDLLGPLSGPGGFQKTSNGRLYLESLNTYTGPTLLNAGSIVLRGAGAIANSSLINLAAGTLLDASQASAVTLGAGQTLAGFGSVAGDVAAGTGATITPGTALAAATLSISNSLTLNGGSTNIIKLSSNAYVTGNGVNDLIVIGSNLVLNGTCVLEIVPTGTLDGSTSYTVMQYNTGTYGNGALLGSGHFTAFCSNPRYTVTVDTTSQPGSVVVNVSGNAAPLLWQGTVAGSQTLWDHTTANWLNTGTSQQDVFLSGDITTFDDTAATNLVTITGAETPGAITMANNALSYTFTGGLLSSETLDLEGSGALTLAMTNVPVLGTIKPSAGTLIFNIQGVATYTNNATFSDNGSAAGTIIKAGTNTLILGRDSQYMTATLAVTNGILQYTNAANLGAAQYPLYATNNGTLDLGTVYPGLKNIIIGDNGFNGQGALISSKGLSSDNGPANVALASDAAIGAPGSVRWDFSNPASGHSLQINGNGYKLTKVGTGTIIIYDQTDGDTHLGDIDIAQGRLGFQLANGGTALLGDPNKTLTVESNATLTFFDVIAGNMSKQLVLHGGNGAPATSMATFDSAGAATTTNTWFGPVTLIGTNNLFGLRRALVLSNNVSGSGGFVVGPDAIGGANASLIVYGNNTYTGPTVISNNYSILVGPGSSLGNSSLITVHAGAKLDVSALSALGLGAGQTLEGAGTVAGNLDVGSGATLAPGLFNNTAYTLTVNGTLTFESGSTNLVVVNKGTSVANDTVAGLTSVAINGTLVINNVGNALAAGDAIKLFTASSGYSGAFSSILPATPGAGLLWDTSTLLTDGTLRVLRNGPPTTPTNLVYSVSGNQVTLSWPSSYTGWTLQAQTNASGQGLTTTWYDVPGSAATNQVFMPIDLTKGSVFYRMVLH